MVNLRRLKIFYISSGNPSDLSPNDEWDYGNKSSSLLPPDKTSEVLNWLEFNQTEMVSTITLDSFCQEQKIKQIDFIHMDVQGAELLVLKGAENLISSIKIIWLEVENITLYKEQPLLFDIENFMKQKGFTKIKDTVEHISGDQLWVNLDYFPRKKITHKLWKLYTYFTKE